jgi:hypothetical protein
MGKFRLAFGIHNHQPVGNFDAVFEQSHRDAYRPFIELAARFPRLRFSLHQSGILWRWQQETHPDYFRAVGELVDRGQVELMTGGFYEPILTAIPERDILGQIQMLNLYVRKHFEVEPTGLWLTERVWEPHLPKLLAQAGVKYLPVDDTHFIFAGLDHSKLTGPYTTEHEGYMVILLPILKRLRYLIPFGKVEEVIAELRGMAEKNPEGVAVYADDGEKFGSWPNTHKHCYDDGWLQDFFTALEQNSDWLEVVPLGEAAAMKPVGRTYLPSASYEEMLHWALPPAAYVEFEQFEHQLKDSGQWKRFGRFVRGSHWRNFLAKYDEANLMHKKMLGISNRLAEAERTHAGSHQVEAARDRLYASQCNCPYWHGVFGGLYLPHIRQAVYAAMIEADSLLREVSGETGVSIRVGDYDSDGVAETLAETNEITAIFKPDRGGMLLDLSLNARHFNLTDTLTRRREGYHLKLEKASIALPGDTTASIHDLVLAKEPGLAKLLVEDWYLKRCFIDHFLPDSVTPEMFQSAKYREDGDFVLGAYQCRGDQKRGTISLTRDGQVWQPESTLPVRITKTFSFEDGADRVGVTYELSSGQLQPGEVIFAVENNFTFQAGHAEDRYILIDNRRPRESYLDSIGRHSEAGGLAMVDEYLQLAVALTSDRRAEIWHMPIFTVSLSEAGFEKVYQGTTIVQLFRLQLTSKPLILKLELFAGELASVLSQAFIQPAVSAR